MFELTKTIAQDLNDLMAKSLEKDQPHSSGFDILWYKKCKPDFSTSYCYYLATLMKYYNEKHNRKWISVDGDQLTISASHATQYFFEKGGYMKIFQEEMRDQKIKELTEKQLQKNIFQLKYWWWVVIISTVISTLFALISKWLLP